MYVYVWCILISKVESEYIIKSSRLNRVENTLLINRTALFFFFIFIFIS